MTRPTPISAAAAVRAVSDPLEAALALRAQGHIAAAIELLVAAGRTSDHHNLRADLQSESGRLAEAVETYAAVAAQEPENLHALSGAATSLYRLSRWEEAADFFKALLTQDPHRDDARILLGDCLLRSNRIEEALVSFERCWSQGAKARAEFGKAVALQLLRRFDQAEAAYERALRADPRMEQALLNLITMSMEVFDLQRVREYSLRLLELNPENHTALRGLTLIALERRDYDEAARYFARLPESAGAVDEKESAGDDGDPVEYRLSREVVARLQQSLRMARDRGRVDRDWGQRPT